jgi:hypothetical protein
MMGDNSGKAGYFGCVLVALFLPLWLNFNDLITLLGRYLGLDS